MALNEKICAGIKITTNKCETWNAGFNLNLTDEPITC